MSSSVSLGIPSALQSHSSPKTIALGISYTNKSNVIFNYANTIWIQDQAFTDCYAA